MRLTASRLGLARKCAWWARAEVVVPTQASTAAEVGTALHAVAEREAEEVDEQAVEEAFRTLAWLDPKLEQPCDDEAPVTVDDYDPHARLSASERAALEALVVSWRNWWASNVLHLDGVETEKAYALDLSTGGARELPRQHARDYSAATDSEICGTADLIAVRDGVLEVYDYKTGRGPHRYRDHEEQLRFLGAAAALEHGAHEVRVVVAHVTPDGVLEDGRTLDSLDLAVIVHELRELVGGDNDGRGRLADSEPRPGLHCEEDYCPARAVCPATRALLIEAKMPLDERRRLPLVGPPKTEEETYARLVAIPLLEALLEDWKRTAKAFADEHGGVRAPDGRVYKARPTKRESPRLDAADGETALVEVLGQFASAAIQVKRSTSWSAIKKVARDAGLPVGDTEELARAAFRARGALKVSEYDSYEWKAER